MKISHVLFGLALGTGAVVYFARSAASKGQAPPSPVAGVLRRLPAGVVGVITGATAPEKKPDPAAILEKGARAVHVRSDSLTALSALGI